MAASRKGLSLSGKKKARRSHRRTVAGPLPPRPNAAAYPLLAHRKEVRMTPASLVTGVVWNIVRRRIEHPGSHH